MKYKVGDRVLLQVTSAKRLIPRWINGTVRSAIRSLDGEGVYGIECSDGKRVNRFESELQPFGVEQSEK